jgi:hypothetical protein
LFAVVNERDDDEDDGGYWWWQSKSGKLEKWEVYRSGRC